jgi:hypothetical protein
MRTVNKVNKETYKLNYSKQCVIMKNLYFLVTTDCYNPSVTTHTYIYGFNILVWFQVSLHAATRVICIKFPVAKNPPQGLLNIELTKKSHVSPPLSQYNVNGLQVFKLHTMRTFIITVKGPAVPQVLSILMEYTNKTLEDFTAFMTQ